MMQPQTTRRVNNNNNMPEMDDGRRKLLKEQASTKRMLEAKKQAFCKYPEDLKEAEFNLQPQQQIEVDAQLTSLLRRCLGDHNTFRQVLRKGKCCENLLLGLDNTVPGTPEVNDLEFEGPFNGLLEYVRLNGKNGVNLVNKKSKQTEFAEPKGKAECRGGQGSASKNKPAPKPLDMQKQSKGTTRTPNNMDIGDIIKKMTQTLPDTLTDIETPGKVPTSKTFEFPRTASSQVCQANRTSKLDEEVFSEGDSSIKEEPRGNEEESSRQASKKVGRSKTTPNLKATTGEKSKGRTISTSSTSSSDESDGKSSDSSDSESEKTKVNRTKKSEKSGSAASSPSTSTSASPSNMHKTTKYGCSNYIFNKENKLHPGLPYDFPHDASLKQSIEINDFPYVQPNKNHDTDDSTRVDNHPSLSPMDIETISPLDPSSLFDGLDFTNYNSGNDELMPPLQSKPDDFVKCAPEGTTKVRPKLGNPVDEYRETCLDDDDSTSNRLLMNKPRKAGVLYQKDSKTNSKLYKSNETKHISKSKSTRVEGASTVPTKAARKYIPPDGRRKSVSDSDKEDGKSTRGSKDSSAKKNSAEKSANTTTSNNNNKKEKTPKRDRLKPKLAVAKNNINLDRSGDESGDDKKPIPDPPDITSPPPTQLLPCTSASTTAESMPPTLLKTTTCSIMHDPMPNLTTDSVCPTIPNEFIPPFHSVDERFFDDVVPSSFGTTLSPMNSPECLVPKCTEPPQLVKEIKDEEMAPPYDISASPVRDFVELPNQDADLVNVSINSQGSSLVNDMFTTSQSRINDHITSYDIFPSSLSLDELHVKSQPLLLPEISTESILLDPLQEIKPDVSDLQGGLWINDDLDSVNDIENIVPKTPLQPPDITSGGATVELSDSSKGVLSEKCIANTAEPICNNEIPTKLTIRIPLAGIKLKSNRCRNRTYSTCKNDTIVDSSLSPNSDSFEIDVVNDRSPLKRKRKKLHSLSDSENCAGDVTNNDTVKDVSTKLDVEYQDLEKLIIRISLAKLRRAPLKEPLISDIKEKERPPKVSKQDPELVNSDVSTNQEQTADLDHKSPDILASSPYHHPNTTTDTTDEMKETEDCHKNDLSRTTETPSADRDTKKKRGRPPKDKLSKPDVKQKLCKEEDLLESCETTNDVCHECGTLRKDYGRDPGRMNSYRNSYTPYYTGARECKHRADNLKTPIERAHKYTEAVLKYVQYLIGMEVNGKLNVMQGVEEFTQITSECTHLVDYVITNYGRKENSKTTYDARFLLLCLRLQSILYLKLFKVKKDSAMKYSKFLSRYFKSYRAGHTGPIQYPKPTHNRGSTGTPSPSSPSPGPSPGGSVASIGSAGSSAGSTGSNDITANGHPNGCVTIPIDVHEKAFQHLLYSKNLLHGHQLWDESDVLTNSCQSFVTKLSRKAGQLTMQSSFLHVVDYVTAGLELIKECPLS